jgi:hypothetical protein
MSLTSVCSSFIDKSQHGDNTNIGDKIGKFKISKSKLATILYKDRSEICMIFRV